MRRLIEKIRGFSAIEALMVIGLLSIFAVAAIGVSFDVSDETAFEITINRMIAVRNAMIGDPDQREGGTRTNFGFLGDMGAIPTNAVGLSGLTSSTGYTIYAPDATSRFGHGWKGPYLSAGLGQSITTDGWGTALV